MTACSFVERQGARPLIEEEEARSSGPLPGRRLPPPRSNAILARRADVAQLVEQRFRKP